MVGAGPAGLHMAASLKHRGIKDITVFEKYVVNCGELCWTLHIKSESGFRNWIN